MPRNRPREGKLRGGFAFVPVTRVVTEVTRVVTPYGMMWRMARHSNSKLKMTANYRLKSARVLKGMTQLQLASRVGLKEIEISRIETGRADANVELKRRIAEVLQKPTFELFNA